MSLSLVGLLNTVSPKPGSSRHLGLVRYGVEPRHVMDVYAPSETETPPPAAPRSYPVLLFFYGNAWLEGSSADFAFVGRSLAALGYVVAIPDYRGSTDGPYPAFLEDCALATDWMRVMASEYGGAGDWLALVGHSAGAYNAAMIALDPRYNLRGRIKAVAGLSGPYDFFPFTEAIGRRTFGHVPDGPATQPINHVTAEAPPMFLGHGSRDTLVGRRNAESLSAKLRAAGVPVEVHHYAALGHAGPVMELGSLIRNRSTLFADLRTFLTRYV